MSYIVTHIYLLSSGNLISNDIEDREKNQHDIWFYPLEFWHFVPRAQVPEFRIQMTILYYIAVILYTLGKNH